MGGGAVLEVKPKPSTLPLSYVTNTQNFTMLKKIHYVAQAGLQLKIPASQNPEC